MSVKTNTVSFFSFTEHLTLSALYALKYLFKHVVDGKLKKICTFVCTGAGSSQWQLDDFDCARIE